MPKPASLYVVSQFKSAQSPLSHERLSDTGEMALPIMGEARQWSPSMLNVASENHMASTPPLRSLQLGKDINQLMQTVAIKQSLQDMFNQQD